MRCLGVGPLGASPATSYVSVVSSQVTADTADDFVESENIERAVRTLQSSAEMAAELRNSLTAFEVRVQQLQSDLWKQEEDFSRRQAQKQEGHMREHTQQRQQQHPRANLSTRFEDVVVREEDADARRVRARAQVVRDGLAQMRGSEARAQAEAQARAQQAEAAATAAATTAATKGMLRFS